jgi:hypothetical protein
MKSRSLSLTRVLGLLLLCLLLDAVACWAAILSVRGGRAASSCCFCASSSWVFCPGSEASRLPVVLEVKQL